LRKGKPNDSLFKLLNDKNLRFSSRVLQRWLNHVVCCPSPKPLSTASDALVIVDYIGHCHCLFKKRPHLRWPPSAAHKPGSLKWVLSNHLMCC